MKQNQFFLILTLILTTFSIQIFAQTYTLEGVGRNALRNSGTIVDGNIIRGYFYFYYAEKVSRKTANYEIVILDENLDKKASETITESRQVNMIEASYNGTSILFKFFDYKTKEVFYRTMDRNGKLSDKSTRAANKYESAAYLNSISKDLKNVNLNNVSEDYFVDVITYKGKKYTYKSICLDNQGEEVWTYTGIETKGVNTGSFLVGNKDQIILVTGTSKSILSRDYTFGLIAIDIEGEELFNVDLNTTKYTLLPHNAFIDPNNGDITVLGEYYDADDKSAKAESKGIFIKVLDKNGDKISTKYHSWTRDIGTFLDPEDKRAMKSYSIFFHNIQMTKSGRIIAIGEQYRKQVSAGGVALKVLAASSSNISTDASSLEMKIGKMLTVTFDDNYEIETVNVLDKKEKSIILPQEYSLVNRHLMAKYMKAEGSFDYNFTQSNEDNTLLTLGFTDREKEKGKVFRQAKFHLVNFIDGEKEPVEDVIDLKTDATAIYVFPAKPGYIMLAEYFRKEKELVVRLEPINY